MKVLVTGGTGYIGSHTVIELLKANKDVVIVDNLSNSKMEVLNRIYQVTGKKVKFYKASVQDEAEMRKIFEKENFTDVIHFAGYKAVGESCAKPEMYFANNIGSTLVLLQLMKEYNVNNIVFSSSATVYGNVRKVPLVETDPIGGCTNPYGETKYQIELILKHLAKLNPNLNVMLLRYFNPIGAHESGLLGEDPNGIPNNLMPYITQVACGKLKELGVFGNDYNTVDGTGVRDYIHVVDLALGHLAALEGFKTHKGVSVYNLGTGRGTSVLELVHAFEEANNIKIPYSIKPRRPGDIDASFADASKAYKELNWKATHTIVDACRDSWNWQKNNPNGFGE